MRQRGIAGRLDHLVRRGLIWLSQAGFPFALPSVGSSAAARARRRRGRREILRRWPLPVRPFAAILMVPGWGLGAWLTTQRTVRAYRARLPEDATTLSVWVGALRHNSSPREVIEYGLWEIGARADDWLMELELFRLWEALSSPRARAFAADKVAFAAFCAVEGLSHPETLAVWRDGFAELAVQHSDWPAGVVLKPAGASNAEGFEDWHRAEGTYRHRGLDLDTTALADRAARLSLAWGVVLAQPLLTLHPDLAARGLPGMPVARLLTGLWPGGEIELLDAYLSSPNPGQVASNAGYGPKWPIAPDTGTVEAGLSRMLPPWPGPLPIEGLTLPGWAKAVEMACAGHRAFPQPVPVLGWDVAFTPTGPVALEVNTGVSFAMPQATRQQPAGPGRAGQLIDAWLARG